MQNKKSVSNDHNGHSKCSKSKFVNDLNNYFNETVKIIKAVIKKAKAGSKKHIAILVCGVAIIVSILGLTVWGVSSLISSGDTESKVDADTIEIDPNADDNYDKNASSFDKDKYGETILPEGEDAGQKYIDETLFIGDSNVVRSLMYETTGTTWENVIGAVGMGIQNVATEKEKIVKFTTPTEPVDILTAVQMIQPKRIIITCGTNNANWKVESFIKEYKKALKAIYDAYPYSDIIVNAIPPVDRIRNYPHITMQQIDTFNNALAEMCEEEGYKFLNSAEVLKDSETGFAKKDYTIEDGIHLSKIGFTALFEYIRTHSYETEDRRPEIKYCPKRNEKEMPTIGEDPIPVRGSVKVTFVSDNYDLGTVDGEVEQNVKYTRSSKAVKAVPKTDNGGYFVGWSAEQGSISNPASESISLNVPQLSETVKEIKVVAKFAQVGLNISKTSLSLEKGGSANISASINTDRFTGDKTISWSSSNPEIVSVDQNGNVTALANGTAKITASILGGKISATCTVSVDDILKSISIASKENTNKVYVGKILQLYIVSNPEGAKVGNVSWSSSDPSIAKVDSVSGIVTTLKEGMVTITASVNGGKMTATYNIECIKENVPDSKPDSNSSESKPEPPKPEPPKPEPSTPPTPPSPPTPKPEETTPPTPKPEETTPPTPKPEETTAPAPEPPVTPDSQPQPPAQS